MTFPPLRPALLALVLLAAAAGPSRAQEGQGAPNSSEAGPSDAGAQSSPATGDKRQGGSGH